MSLLFYNYFFYLVQANANQRSGRAGRTGAG